jgi:HlyD family secretion protein
MSKKKILLIVAAVVVVGGGFVVLNLTMSSEKATEVYAAEIKTQKIVEEVSASGRIQPKTKVDITAEVNAEILAIPVKEGQRVEVGDLLVVLDTVQTGADLTGARYRLDELTARLAAARTSLDQAKEEFDRQQRLFDQNLTSETAYKDARYAFLNAKSSYDAMEAQSLQVRAAYEKEKDYFQKSKITSPMAGVVTFLDADIGEIAAAQTPYSRGKVLMTISDLSIFEVEVEVDETEVNKIAVAQESKISIDAMPDTTFVGRVVEIGNTAILAQSGSQDQSTNFKVKVTLIDPNQKLRPGMSATVDITTAQVDNTKAVPFSSVVTRNYDLDSLIVARVPGATQGGEVHAAETSDSTHKDTADGDKKERDDLKGVFVIKGGKAFFKVIQTGVADQKDIQVVQGLDDKDTVVSGPYRVLRTLNDNAAVKIVPMPGSDQEGKRP